MEWHFGHNCKHFVPTLGKCRVFITRYKQRADLMAEGYVDRGEDAVELAETALPAAAETLPEW